ncbi:unnamed protein product [Symbiodinium natans]|uniref:Uncharacterized protein n=1 Tax=Symbiodinium natans TaxID=878477 RepID=A0A812PWC4_9DINO|nr:unnamed protein product [Symbiodinium natans]
MRRPPELEDIFRNAATPLVGDWLSAGSFAMLADQQLPCLKVLVVLDWVSQKLHESFQHTRDNFYVWKDILIAKGFQGQTSQEWFTSSNYYSLLNPIMDMHRICSHFTEFIQAVVMVHGERCLYPELRDAIGASMLWLVKLSQEVHKVQLAGIYHSRYALYEVSTDVLRHMLPPVDVLHYAAKFADAFSEVRIILDQLADKGNGARVVSLPAAGPSRTEDDGGAFSDMTFIADREKNERSDEVSSNVYSHTGTVDRRYCCHAFDGSPRAAYYTSGLVQTQRLDEPFDLGRRFDWLICLEVMEHIPASHEAVALANLRRHATKGLILSWSQEGGANHVNARNWASSREVVEAAGFKLDADSTRTLRTQVAWLHGSVNVFNVAE